MTQPPAAPDTDRRGRFIPLLPARLVAGLAVAILTVVLIAFFTFRTLQSREEAVERVTHTIEVREQLQALISSVKDAETGQRGFLLTGEERYLEPYTNAKAALPSEIKILRSMTADNPQQQQRLDALDQLTGEKVKELEETIQLRRAQNPEGALAIVRTDRGKAVMDRIRALLAEMENEEEGLLATRQTEWQDGVVISTRVTTGGSLLLIGLIVAGGVLMSRDYRTREISAWRGTRSHLARMATRSARATASPARWRKRIARCTWRRCPKAT